MSEEKFVTVELGYKGTDFTRKYKIGGVSDAALATLKEKILAYNANLPAVDKAVFVADDGESPLTGITAAQYTYVAAQDISLDSVPIIYDILMTPETLNVMQQQFTTATVTAVTNEFVSDLTFELQDAPAWVSMVENVIRVQPTDNELGATIITVVAKDTGSNEQTAAQFTVNVRARPIINSAAVTPATVNAIQGTTETATITAVANEAVQSLTYELEDAPAWITNDEDIILISPTENDLGTVTVSAVVKDAHSSAQANTEFVANAKLRPVISSVAMSPATIEALQFDTDPAIATLSAVTNEGVQSVLYELDLGSFDGTASIEGDRLFVKTNTTTDQTLTVIAKDTGSAVEARETFHVIGAAAGTITALNLVDTNASKTVSTATVLANQDVVLSLQPVSTGFIKDCQYQPADTLTQGFVKAIGDGQVTLHNGLNLALASKGTLNFNVTYNGDNTFQKSIPYHVKLKPNFYFSPDSHDVTEPDGTVVTVTAYFDSDLEEYFTKPQVTLQGWAPLHFYTASGYTVNSSQRPYYFSHRYTRQNAAVSNPSWSVRMSLMAANNDSVVGESIGFAFRYVRNSNSPALTSQRGGAIVLSGGKRSSAKLLSRATVNDDTVSLAEESEDTYVTLSGGEDQ